MGITRSLATFLAIASRTWPIEEPVLVLGKQHVYVTFAEWKALCNVYGAGDYLDSFEASVLTDMPLWTYGQKRGFIADTALLRGVGCKQVDFLDISGYEGANIVHDLNRPVPTNLLGRYKTIIDAGTCEHIFDVKTCFHNLHEMAQPGATIIHFTQGGNYLNHGFYQFSPTFFYDLYAKWASENMQCYLTYQGFGDCTRNVWTWYTYKRQDTGAMALDAGCYGLTFIATKTSEKLADAGSPQQGYASSPVPYPPPTRPYRLRHLAPGFLRASLRRLKLRPHRWKQI